MDVPPQVIPTHPSSREPYVTPASPRHSRARGNPAKNKARRTHTIQKLDSTHANGVFERATPVDLVEGTKFVISVTEETEFRTDSDGLRFERWGWSDIVDYEQLIHAIFERRTAIIIADAHLGPKKRVRVIP